MDEKSTLNALWIMFHDLMDLLPPSPPLGPFLEVGLTTS